MKKLFLMLLVSAAALTSCSTLDTSASDGCESQEISLKATFEQLSKVQNIAITAPDYNLPVIADVISDGRIAAAYNLDATKIKESGDEAMRILSKLPLSKIVNGGANGEVCALVYAEPNDKGSNDTLIAVISGFRGTVVFMYGTMDDVAKEAIRNAPLTIDGINLNLETALPDGNEFRIVINKAR